MLTAAEFDRLPELLQDIVVEDRKMDEVRRVIAKPVAPIGAAAILRARRALRTELTEKAAQLWGHRLGGEEPTHR